MRLPIEIIDEGKELMIVNHATENFKVIFYQFLNFLLFFPLIYIYEQFFPI